MKMKTMKSQAVTLLTAAITSLGFAEGAGPSYDPVSSTNVWFVYDTMNTVTPRVFSHEPDGSRKNSVLIVKGMNVYQVQTHRRSS